MTAPELNEPRTIAECDADLMAVRAAYLAAVARDDISACERTHDRLDHLLDLRCHLPAER